MARSLLDVWQHAAEVAGAAGTPPLLVAGPVADIPQAVAEAEAAAGLGDEAALLSPWGLSDRSEDALIERATAVGREVLTQALAKPRGPHTAWCGAHAMDRTDGRWPVRRAHRSPGALRGCREGQGLPDRHRTGRSGR